MNAGTMLPDWNMDMEQSGFALSYDPVPKAGLFLTTSIPIEKSTVESRVKVLF